MRRIVAALLMATVFTSACSDQQPMPTEPAFPTSDIVVPGCPTPLQITQQIAKLFPLGSGLILSEATFVVIVLKVQAGRSNDAKQLTRDLIAFTLTQYNNNKLIGGKSAATLAKVGTLTSSLDCFAGLPQPIPPGSTDVVVAVVTPTTSATVVTPAAQAGIQIKPGDVAAPTLITVYTVSDTLLTNLDKYPTNYQFTTSGGDFTTPVLVGLCTNAPDAILPRLRIAHNVPDPNPTGIEILPAADPGALVLNCNTETSLTHDSRNIAVRALHGLGRQVSKWISPTTLSAAAVGGTGVAGKTKKLSTFGVVDPVTIKFQSSGYRYSFATPIAGWEQLGFSDGSWLLGQAAFANSSGPCPALAASIHTAWAGFDGSLPEVFIRKHFKAELGTSSVSIQLAIDNDAKVFVNGNDITSSATASKDEGGFVIHENCAELSNAAYVFTAPTGILNVGGDNVVAIRGRDRGSMAYLDQQTTLVVPVAP